MSRPILFLLLIILTTLLPTCSLKLLPGDIQIDPNFIELYYGQRHQIQLKGVCQSVLRVSLAAALASKLNSSLSSKEAHFRGLYLESRGSSKKFMSKLFSFGDRFSGGVIHPVLSYDKKTNELICTRPLFAQCRVVASTPFYNSADISNNKVGTTSFNARFTIDSSDASVFMCNSDSGARKPTLLFVNTLPTLNELIASLDVTSKEVTVRCSGVMSSVLSAVYLWELLVVSPGGDSHRLSDKWVKVNYTNDKPGPGLRSAILTAVLPTSQIPVATVTFYCQIVDILGRTFTQKLLPFVLESVMQLPRNIRIEMEKLSPIDVLGALPDPLPNMMPLPTFYRLRCSFDSVAPQLVRIVWESYFFDPKQASYKGKRYGLDHQFILVNETLYNHGHHLCRVWLKDTDPSSSVCSEPSRQTPRPVPLCKKLEPSTNVSALMSQTDLLAFVPIGEKTNSEPNRDLIVQSMTTALIVLSCVSGVFFLCLIMMIGRFHCRLRPHLDNNSKRMSGKNAEGAGAEPDTSDPSRLPPNVSRRNSFPGDVRLATEETDGQRLVGGMETNNNAATVAQSGDTNVASMRLFGPPRPANPTFITNGRQPPMADVSCGVDFDNEDMNESLMLSDVPLLHKSSQNGSSAARPSSSKNGKDRSNLTSPATFRPSNDVRDPSETPAPVNVLKSGTQSSISSRRASSSTALNASSNDSHEATDAQGGSNLPLPNIQKQSSAKSCGTIDA